MLIPLRPRARSPIGFCGRPLNSALTFPRQTDSAEGEGNRRIVILPEAPKKAILCGCTIFRISGYILLIWKGRWVAWISEALSY